MEDKPLSKLTYKDHSESAGVGCFLVALVLLIAIIAALATFIYQIKNLT